MSSHSGPTGRGCVALVVLVALVAMTGVLGAGPAPSRADAAPSAVEGQGRTWVVDGVDDARGSRWVSEDTGTSEVTVHVGDTVEWQFDRAVIDHDLTSQNSRSSWHPEVAEYRHPGGTPVSYTFAEPGVYDYLCSIHGTVMRGTVVVEEAGSAGEAPLVTANAQPTSGPAPLIVDFLGTAEDEQGGVLTYAWDFGVEGADDDVADSARARYAYADPGIYTATLTVTDGDGDIGTDAIDIVVTGDIVQSLPRVAAMAAPPSGAAPLDVAFSTEVTTGGEVEPFADGLATYPDLAGTAELVRARGQTHASLEVTGLKAGAHHMVHVHEQACSSQNGGAHFRFEETKPFAEENEIWLPFSSDAAGRSGLVEVTQPQRAGPRAVSIVIHDPDNPAKRIGCVNLVPSTADLGYAWDFGDGTAAEGSDPGHTYVEAGTYTATVTVSSAHAGHGTGHVQTVTDSVEIVVDDSEPPQTRITSGPTGTVRAHRASFRLTSSEPGSTFDCRLDRRAWDECSSRVTFRDLRDGRHRLRVRATDSYGNTDATPAVRRWTVDTVGPAIRRARPTGATRDRTPMVRATVSDRLSAVRRRDVQLRIDGRLVTARYAAPRERLTWTPRRALSPGPHAVRLVAGDATGNRTAETWEFWIRR